MITLSYETLFAAMACAGAGYTLGRDIHNKKKK